MTKNHILIDLSASDKTSFGKEDFARQSLPQRVFSAIMGRRIRSQQRWLLPILPQQQRGIRVLCRESPRKDWRTRNCCYLQACNSGSISCWITAVSRSDPLGGSRVPR